MRSDARPRLFIIAAAPPQRRHHCCPSALQQRSVSDSVANKKDYPGNDAADYHAAQVDTLHDASP